MGRRGRSGRRIDSEQRVRRVRGDIRARLDGLPLCNGQRILPNYLLDHTGRCNKTQLDSNSAVLLRPSRPRREELRPIWPNFSAAVPIEGFSARISLPSPNDSSPRYPRATVEYRQARKLKSTPRQGSTAAAGTFVQPWPHGHGAGGPLTGWRLAAEYREEGDKSKWEAGPY